MKRAPNTPTQEARVAKALRFSGARGIDQTMFDGPTVDGFPPIRRLASRINDLRSKGWIIDSSQRRLGMSRYVLMRESPAPTSASTVESDASLFDSTVGVAPPRSPYDTGADA